MVEFDGVDDGLVVAANAIAGLPRFTLEVEFRPAAGGAEEQRFVHAQEAGDTENRALVELRMQPDGRWALDTFLRSPAPGLTLLDRAQTHAPDAWHTAALVYDGRTMTHTVDGVRQGRGEVVFTPLGGGTHRAGHAPQPRLAFQGPAAPIADLARGGADDSALARRRARTSGWWRRGALGRRTGQQHPRPQPGVPGPDRPADRHRGHRRPRRLVRAAGHGQRGGRRGRAAAGRGRRDVRPQVPRRRLPLPGAAAGRAAGGADRPLAGRRVRRRAGSDRHSRRLGRRTPRRDGRHALRRARRTHRASARRGERPARLPRAALSRRPDGRTGRPSRLAPQPAGRDAGRHAGRADVDRSAGDGGDAADFPRPHGGRSQRAARTQPGAVPGAARRRGAVRTARLRAGRARLRLPRRPRADLGVAVAVVRVDAGPRLAAAGCGHIDHDRGRRRRRAALGAWRRGPAQGRPGRRHVPQPDPRRRSSRPVGAEGRRRLLHDVLVVRRLSGAGRLALARPGELDADRPGAAQERRRGLGPGSRQAPGPLLHLLPRASAPIARTTWCGPTTSAGRGAIPST